MENSVIVTVRYAVGREQREMDFELPYDVPAGPLSTDFLRFLHENGLCPYPKNHYYFYYFYCGRRRLNSEKTLRENKIYDGNILTFAP